ncbi:MAG: SCO family protein [Betaproteobacteria bacterium]|nr:MAG: SCO family protein [Betaproteobacteria bacterium]
MSRFFLCFLFMAGLAWGHNGKVDFDPRPGAQLPLALAFEEAGKPVRLERFFGRTPVVLLLGYQGCVNLCSTTLRTAADALERTGLRAGADYVALFVSIDPRDEKAPPERRPGWHFLTGARSAAALARSIGFEFIFEKESGEFAHPAGFVVLTPLGTVARHFPGVGFEPRAVRAGIEQAARGESSSAFERLLLVCFHDPVSGRYSETVLDALRLAIAAFLAALAWFGWRRLR